MESVMIIATTIIAILGVVCYVALAGIAVVYSLGGEQKPKRPPYLLWHPGRGNDLCIRLYVYLFA